MKNLLLIYIIVNIFSLDVFAQDSTRTVVINPLSQDVTYLQVENRVSYRFLEANYENRNVRIERISNNLVRCDTLDDSNNVIISVECSIQFYEYIITTGADSILLNQVNQNILGNDSTLPAEIVIYKMRLVKNGLYQKFYSDGKLQEVGNYKNNIMIGKWKYYDRYGVVIRIVRY